MILFNHIPKTGGTTLRIILNRVYGIEKVFFIETHKIKSSLNKFSVLDKTEQNKYKVIAGHGANMFSEFIDNPFMITNLREPIELFISQYFFLRIDTTSLFYKEVSKLKNIEEYLEYAESKGLDNLLTRNLANSMQFLVDPQLPIPDLNKEGDQLLQKAILNLRKYGAIIDLHHFDKGVFALSQKLNWNQIPIYRPSNINKNKTDGFKIKDEFLDHLKHALRFDISLYEKFKEEKIDIASKVNNSSIKFMIFSKRQRTLNTVAKLMGKT